MTDNNRPEVLLSAADHWEDIKMGNAQAFTRVQDRRFVHKDGTTKQNEEECSMLLNPAARLVDGLFSS